MAKRNVLQFGNPLLRETSIEVTEFQSPEVQKTARNLEDTLSDLQRIHGKGGGLAAPLITVRKVQKVPTPRTKKHELHSKNRFARGLKV